MLLSSVTIDVFDCLLSVFKDSNSSNLQCPFYWGPLDKDTACAKLANQPDGVFLLRDSSDARHFFALSFRMYERTHHVRISFSGGKYCMHAGRFLLRVVAASELL